MSKHSMICAGIDTGKRKLDVALAPGSQHRQVENSAEGYSALAKWLRSYRVKRVGIEARAYPASFESGYALDDCFSMSFSQNRFPLLRDMP